MELIEQPVTLNMATCRCCGVLVEKIEYKGKYYNLRRQRWNGRMCPTCNVSFTRNNMQKNRQERKDGINDEWTKLEGKDEA
jgi:hypothetical protein